jgi:hypothetical protein
VGILNINGFFDPLLQIFDQMVETGFLNKTNRDILIVGTDPEKILQELKSAPAFAATKWHEKT